MIEVEAPDGSIIEFPEGTTDEVIIGVMRDITQDEPAEQPQAQNKAATQIQVSQPMAAAAGAADMLSFGFADELAGRVAGLTDVIGQKMGGPSLFQGDPVGETTQYARETQRAAKEQYPKTYLGGQVAGALVPYGGAAKGGLSIAKGAGIGGVQGGLYGFGSGEGSAQERLPTAAMGGALGLGGGAGGVLLSRQLGKVAQSKPIQSLAERAKALYQKPKANAVIQSGAEKQLKTLSKGGEDVFSMTKGQKTQMPQAQRLEADALAGVYGDEAERAVRSAQIAQSRERQSFISQLGDIDRVGDVNDVLEGVFETIKSQSKALKGQVNDAYALAREGGGTKISVDDIKDGLFNRVVGLKREGQYDLNMLPQANARTKELAKLVRKSEGGRFTNASLSAMENWRKRVTNSIQSTQDKTEKQFLRGVLDNYDEFMYKTANEAVDQNDQAAILSFRDAVSKRREYGKLYESDKFVQDLVSGKKGVDDAVKDLMGTGSIVGKKRMESTYDAIIKAAGDEARIVRSDLQAGFAKKLLDQSINGLETGGENAYLSAAKTKKALEGLFVNNRKFAEKLYGKQAVETAKKAIQDLEKISSTQVATQNPSGSGQLVLRQLMNLPFMSTLKEGVNFTIIKPVKTSAVSKAVDPVVNQIQSIKIQPQSKLFAGAGGKLMAEQGIKE